MTSAYFAPLVTKPVIIDTPGEYLTRGGETVIIDTVSARHDLGCKGTYADGVTDGWHKSGRLYADSECINDIVRANLREA